MAAAPSPRTALVEAVVAADQYWPLTSIFSRAIAVAKVFDKADTDRSGTLSSKEFTAWLRAQSDVLLVVGGIR